MNCSRCGSSTNVQQYEVDGEICWLCEECALKIQEKIDNRKTENKNLYYAYGTSILTTLICSGIYLIIGRTSGFAPIACLAMPELSFIVFEKIVGKLTKGIFFFDALFITACIVVCTYIIYPNDFWTRFVIGIAFMLFGLIRNGAEPFRS